MSYLSYLPGARPFLAMASKEYDTLVSCTGKLEIALNGDREILHFLEQEGYNIPDHDEVSNPRSRLSAQEKAVIVVTAIKNKVRLNSKNYQKLLHHFDSNERVYGDIITILDQAYNKGSLPKNQPSAESGKASH